MSPTRRALFARVSRETRFLTPDLARAILRALALLAEELSEAQLAALIESGMVERLLTRLLAPEVTARAFAPVQDAIRRAVGRETRLFRRDLPKRAQTVGASVGIGFDILNPNVVTAIRTMETRVIATLAENVRGAVRAHVEAGLALGQGPRTIARGLRAVIPLAPSQVRAVQNFERMLREGDREALTRLLRDRRYDATLRRTFAVRGAEESRMSAIFRALNEGWVKRWRSTETEAARRLAMLGAGEAPSVFYHVVGPSWRPGQALLSREAAGGLFGRRHEWVIDPEQAAADVRTVSIHDSLAEAEAWRKELLGGRGRIVAIRVPKSRLVVDENGYFAVRNRIPAEWIRGTVTGPLTEEQVAQMTAVYRRRMVAWNAETNARTAALNAAKLGQRLSWQEAIDKGYVDGAHLMKRWQNVGDDRVRDEHRNPPLGVNGETVPFESPYSTGEMEPGDDAWNCRCLSVVFADTGAARRLTAA